MEESERDTFDREEEIAYREYAAKVGMGGVRLAELYKDIEELYAVRLMENAEAYLSGLISEMEYEYNIILIQRHRNTYRDAIDLYLLGDTDKLDISDLESVKAKPDERDRLFGILKDLTLYMSEEEKRAFVRGEELTRMLQIYDSLFEKMVERYDGAFFHAQYLNDTTIKFIPMKDDHFKYIKHYFDEFKKKEKDIWVKYKSTTQGKLKKYKQALDDLAKEFFALSGSKAKATDFFFEKSWVPTGADYIEFRRIATPGVDATDQFAEKLGKAILTKVEELVKHMGRGMHRMWEIENSWVRVTLFSQATRQNAIDEWFYTYSNAMARMIQHLSAFTDQAGLNYETAAGKRYANWWAINGYKYHMDNYAYSNDEKLRNAYYGYNVIKSITESAFNSRDSEMELEIQKMLAGIFGQNIGVYQYKEFGDEADQFGYDGARALGERTVLEGGGYQRTVVADDRYHYVKYKDKDGNTVEKGYKGTYDKKVKGELGDKWFLHKEDISADATMNAYINLSKYKEDTASTAGEQKIEGDGAVAIAAGQAITAYNDAVRNAIEKFVTDVTNDKLGAITSMQVLRRDGTPVSRLSGGYWDGGILIDPEIGGANIKWSELDLLTLLNDNLKTFYEAMYKAQNELTKKTLEKLLYSWGATGKGARQTIMRTSASKQDTDTGTLWDDVFHLTNTEVTFFEETVRRARDFIENGLPGTSWTDALHGRIDGRKNLHIYAKHKFQEYFTADMHKFTNDPTFDALERVGPSYIKAIGVHYVDKDRSNKVTTQNRAFLDYTRYKHDQPYEVSYLVNGIIEQYTRDKDNKYRKKTYGDGSFAYETDLISSLYSGDFAYQGIDSRLGGGLITDRRGTATPTEDGMVFQNIDKSVRNMREKEVYQHVGSRRQQILVETWDEYGFGARTSYFNALYKSDADHMWGRFIFGMDDREGYFIHRVYDIAGLTPRNMEGVFKDTYDTVYQRLKAFDALPKSGFKFNAMGGVFNGIKIMFGNILSLTDPSSGMQVLDNDGKAVYAFGMVALGNEIKGLTKENVRSRMRRAYEATNAKLSASGTYDPDTGKIEIVSYRRGVGGAKLNGFDLVFGELEKEKEFLLQASKDVGYIGDRQGIDTWEQIAHYAARPDLIGLTFIDRDGRQWAVVFKYTFEGRETISVTLKTKAKLSRKMLDKLITALANLGITDQKSIKFADGYAVKDDKSNRWAIYRVSYDSKTGITTHQNIEREWDYKKFDRQGKLIEYGLMPGYFMTVRYTPEGSVHERNDGKYFEWHDKKGKLIDAIAFEGDQIIYLDRPTGRRVNGLETGRVTIFDMNTGD